MVISMLIECECSFSTLFDSVRLSAGIQHFQMSEKLYTRYSAVAVNPGCPYLDSLNDVYAIQI